MKKITITIFTISIISILSLRPVSAQSQLCRPGTGTDNIPCEPCIPGPYNICTPDTDIIQSIDSVVAEENNRTYLLTSIIMFSGIMFLMNGYILSKKVNN